MEAAADLVVVVVRVGCAVDTVGRVADPVGVVVGRVRAVHPVGGFVQTADPAVAPDVDRVEHSYLAVNPCVGAVDPLALAVSHAAALVAPSAEPTRVITRPTFSSRTRTIRLIATASVGALDEVDDG